MAVSLQAYISLLVFSILLVHQIRRLRSPLRRLPLPPGPKPLPIIGNLLKMPSEFVWETYDKWYKEYQSDIVYVSVAGGPIIIVNTYEAAVELLQKRSALYSDRVPLPMVGELMGWNDWDFAFMPNGEKWRNHRRLFHQEFNANAATQFEPQQCKATCQFILRLIERPGKENLIDHIRHMTGSLIMDIVYGIKVLPDDDPYINIVQRAIGTGTEAATPGRFWVDFIPWLKYVPKWFPGAGFRRLADEWGEYAKEMTRMPFNATKKSMKEGHFTPSFTSRRLDRLNGGSSLYYGENDIRSVAAVAYGAGSDTTAAALATFALAMLQYPEVQKRAQAEVDAVLNGHLPTLDDKESLPYVTAVVYETLRWKAVTPFGVPHRLISDDVYNGYRLPGGSMVIPNIWSMSYDEAIYLDPCSGSATTVSERTHT